MRDYLEPHRDMGPRVDAEVRHRRRFSQGSLSATVTSG
jgi:hypothetical protein